MDIMEIRRKLQKDLNVGSSLLGAYVAMFKEAYNGDKRAIDDFKARYNDDGDGVIFTVTINGKQKEYNVPITKGRYNYKEKQDKTSGEQIKQLLTDLYNEKASWCDLKYDNGNVGVYRLPEMPSVKQLCDALERHGIDPLFVTINDMWGHLTMWFCNWDGTDIDIED